MILYHWTAARFIRSIKAEGLTKGRTPYVDSNGKIAFMDGHIWLTDDGEYEHQTWAIPLTISYSRRVWRIEIRMPKHSECNIMTMDDVCRELGERMLPGFNDRPDLSAHWFVHQGPIPRTWIKNIRYMAPGL